MARECLSCKWRNGTAKRHGLYSYGTALQIHMAYDHDLHSYGLYSHGLHSYGTALQSHMAYDHDLYSCGLYSHAYIVVALHTRPMIMTYIVVAYIVMAYKVVALHRQAAWPI